jgi:hypothetical protein
MSRSMEMILCIAEHLVNEMQYPISAEMLKPAANPRHYSDLMKDIDEAPSRTIATSWWNKVAGKIRMS